MNRLFTILAVVLLLAPASSGNQGGSNKQAVPLDSGRRDLLIRVMQVMDSQFDDRIALIRPLTSISARGADYSQRHLVRETSWYAVGLLLRDQPGDRERAIRALTAILEQQIDEPEEAWHGTFYRLAEEPRPPSAARPWQDYDPNWREFIGTTFEIILWRFSDRLPQQLIERLEHSIRVSIDGEIHEGRLKPSYTNIALLYGALISFAGERFHRADWNRRATEWTDAVYREFKEHGAFPEFNSPTYCGPDLFALALWREYGSTPQIRREGSEMEAALWRTIASLYHAGLKNVSGPYDRSYGMDMRRYASLTGLWLRTVLEPELAPLPAVEAGVDHGNDLAYAPCFLLVPTRIPDDAMKAFRAFQGEHLVRQEITSKRIATAWIGKDHMFGGEFTTLTRDATAPATQFHPATAHWKMRNGNVGWMRLLNAPRVDAVATREALKISCTGDATFRIMAPGAEPKDVQRDRWALPGLAVQVETDATGVSATARDGYIDIVYRDATHFTLRMTPTR